MIANGSRLPCRPDDNYQLFTKAYPDKEIIFYDMDDNFDDGNSFKLGTVKWCIYVARFSMKLDHIDETEKVVKIYIHAKGSNPYR